MSNIKNKLKPKLNEEEAKEILESIKDYFMDYSLEELCDVKKSNDDVDKVENQVIAAIRLGLITFDESSGVIKQKLVKPILFDDNKSLDEIVYQYKFSAEEVRTEAKDFYGEFDELDMNYINLSKVTGISVETAKRMSKVDVLAALRCSGFFII